MGAQNAGWVLVRSVDELANAGERNLSMHFGSAKKSFSEVNGGNNGEINGLGESQCAVLTAPHSEPH